MDTPTNHARSFAPVCPAARTGYGSAERHNLDAHLFQSKNTLDGAAVSIAEVLPSTYVATHARCQAHCSRKPVIAFGPAPWHAAAAPAAAPAAAVPQSRAPTPPAGAADLT